ncbi:MAG: hypothetical protein ABR964_00840 [Tepidisphaeraceae bacterium]
MWRWRWAAIGGGAVMLGVLAACSSDTKSISNNQVPAGVQAAFDAEHPYAKMNHPSVRSNANGASDYVVPYTRPDGTTGQATYSSSGELLEDK